MLIFSVRSSSQSTPAYLVSLYHVESADSLTVGFPIYVSVALTFFYAFEAFSTETQDAGAQTLDAKLFGAPQELGIKA